MVLGLSPCLPFPPGGRGHVTDSVELWYQTREVGQSLPDAVLCGHGGLLQGPRSEPGQAGESLATFLLPLFQNHAERSRQGPAFKDPPQTRLQAPAAGQTPGRRKEGFTQNQDFGEARGSSWGKAYQA